MSDQLRNATPADERGSALVHVVRNGFVEGQHRGSLVVTGPTGEVEWALGDPERVILPRSCNKPIQAVAMLRAGLELPDDLLALACASHSGEARHLAGARRILAMAGLGEEALLTPPDLPFDEGVKEAYLAAGGVRDPLVMNCSGKHAAMLLTCVRNGWSLTDYTAPQHPLQRLVASTFAELTGSPAPVEATDGCGLPVLGIRLVDLARTFAGFASAAPDTELGRIATAMRAHPEMVSGTRRPERTMHAAVPGLVTKIGAEAVLVAGLADGRAVALKVDDGGMRAPAVAMVAALERMGVLDMTAVDGAALRSLGTMPLLGGPVVVGEIRAAF